jgi:hypothetical protein
LSHHGVRPATQGRMLPYNIYILIISISILNISCGVASKAKRIVNNSNIVKERDEKYLIT